MPGPGYSVDTGTSESSARVNSQARATRATPPYTNSTTLLGTRPRHSRDDDQTSRDETDEEKNEDEFSHSCRLRARWINIGICFGIELQDVFKVGMRWSVTEECDSDSESDIHNDEKAAQCATAYKNIINFIPALKRFLPVNRDGDSDKLYKLLETIQKGCNAARSDTFKRVNQFTDKYLNSGSEPIQCDARSMKKEHRGLDHPQIGRIIIPAMHVAEWDKDPESSRARFNSGDLPMMGYSMPVFLYYEYKYNPEDPEQGLFRSAFLVCVLVDILYGPHAVDTTSAKRSEHFRHHCVADMYDAEAVTPPMIAYSAVVARFALSSRRMWKYKEDTFDYRVFYHAIIMRLSDPTDPWVEETFKWWNVRVFGNEGGKTITNKDDGEQEDRDSFAQRKAARKASSAAAVNSTTSPSRVPTPGPFETPADEDEERSMDGHVGQPNSPGNTPHVTQPPSPERNPSPLSSPSGEETSSEATVGVSFSSLGKRKSAKNNTGKGRAPPKQRRKATDGSQSRSGRI